MPTLLVVDDDAEHRELLCSALWDMGYEPTQADNGRVALDSLERTLPDAVLLDLKMPVMSGWQLLEALRQLPRARHIPVVVISAYGYEWEAELVGASGYISKPVDLDRLKATLGRVLGEQPAARVH